MSHLDENSGQQSGPTDEAIPSSGTFRLSTENVKENGAALLATRPPATAAVEKNPVVAVAAVSPPAVKEPLVGIKPDPDHHLAEILKCQEERKVTPPPPPPPRRIESVSVHTAAVFAPVAAHDIGDIDIADLAVSVVREERNSRHNHQGRQGSPAAPRTTGTIQVRRDILDVVGGGHSILGPLSAPVAAAAWSAAGSSSGSSSPESVGRLTARDAMEGGRPLAVLHYPGGPPEGRYLCFPTAANNQSFNQARNSGSPRGGGGLSPSGGSGGGRESMLNGGGSASRHQPPPLTPIIRYRDVPYLPLNLAC